jgi:hypothetical protein
MQMPGTQIVRRFSYTAQEEEVTGMCIGTNVFLPT